VEALKGKLKGQEASVRGGVEAEGVDPLRVDETDGEAVGVNPVEAETEADGVPSCLVWMLLPKTLIPASWLKRAIQLLGLETKSAKSGVLS